MLKKTIVISGANITSGGPLEIFRRLLVALNRKHSNHRVVALVSDSKLYPVYDNVKYIEVPNYKKFILLKFYYEYVRYYFISLKIKPDVWLSLNDCTPSVSAKVRVVYCHNATPFYRKSLRDFLSPTRVFFQSFYYGIFYRININKNNHVVVQQKWLGDYLKSKYGVKKDAIIINSLVNNEIVLPNKLMEGNSSKVFLYPTKAQPYKNIEVICNAAAILESKSIRDFRVIITITGKENRYSKKLFQKYSYLKSIVWLGNLERQSLETLYQSSDCLIFSSKLETWGLPLSEFSRYSKPIYASNLPYAKETLNNYQFVKFFEPDDSTALAALIQDKIFDKEISFDISNSADQIQFNILGYDGLADFVVQNA